MKSEGPNAFDERVAFWLFVFVEALSGMFSVMFSLSLPWSVLKVVTFAVGSFVLLIAWVIFTDRDKLFKK